MEYTTPHQIIYSDHAIRVLCFRPGNDASLILPPQAGHGGEIADWPVEGRSLVRTTLDNTIGGVYLVDWLSCTHARRNETYADLVEQVLTAIEVIGSPVTLIGLCQGGTLAAIYTSIHQPTVNRLIVAGAPIDVSRGESVLRQAMRQPMWVYRAIIAAQSGMVRGEWLCMNWAASAWGEHYIDRYTSPSVEKEIFYSWYGDPKHMAGVLYLEIIEQLFLENRLIAGGFMVAGQTVDLSRITCPVDLIAGTTDDITPYEQLFAMQDLVPHANCYMAPGGHTGLFKGKAAQATWASVFTEK